MRSILVGLAAVGLLAAFSALAPTLDARPSPACSDAHGTCPGLVCVDSNLDGRFDWTECITQQCPEYGCCYEGCPPPPYE